MKALQTPLNIILLIGCAILIFLLWEAKDDLLEASVTSDEFKIEVDSLHTIIERLDSINLIYAAVADEQEALRKTAEAARAKLIRERAYLRKQLENKLQAIRNRPTGDYTIEELENILQTVINQGNSYE